ncbi:MAG: universal stress protein [Anaerolineales bacterium]|jgi:nucleotide-binding universal stress UspA family protein|nr:universal stress protein [Anaerolineales bacterium]
MYKKILVPLDGSLLAEAALTYAEEIAKTEGAEIIILRVPDHIEPKFPIHAYVKSLRQQRETDEEAEEYVNEKVAELSAEHIDTQGITREGPVMEAILAVAEETHADMITLSTHGWKGLQRLLKGSVAEEVVRNAHIPVIVIHPN